VLTAERRGAGRSEISIAVGLLATAAFLNLLPARLQNGSAFWHAFYNGGHAFALVAVLAWLVREAHLERRHAPVNRSPISSAPNALMVRSCPP
jgi:hypothetical protein